MVQGYYTLDEAARILGIEPDKLSQKAQRREIRAFADRGTWRFRTQDIHEEARKMGLGSDPELQLGEAHPGAPAPAAKPPVDEVFDFNLNPPEEGGSHEHEIIIDSPSSSKLHSKPATPVPGAPKTGSDSDVHLVFDVTDDLIIANDSDVKLEEAGPVTSKPSSSKKNVKAPESPSQSGARGKPGAPARSDSGVRLVPLDEGPTPVPARQPTPSDSDIRLEPQESHRGGEAPSHGNAAAHHTELTTEEINLDEELRKEGSGRKLPPAMPGEPEELTVFGLQEEPTPARSPQGPRTPTAIRKTGKETQMRPPDEDEVSLGDLEIPSDLTGASSGINLHSPADSGINLAGSGDSSDDSLEFELSLDEKEATPKPASAKDDSSGEFELTLDEGGLAPLEEEQAAAEGGEKDIFETDFDMPALDEESGSEAVALEEADTDLESSDFDLTLGEEESGSHVVALDDEEADEGAATVARGARGARGGRRLADDDLGDLEAAEDLEEEDEAIVPRRTPVAAGAATPWGALPFAFLAPTAIIMFLTCLMSFELLHGMWGYRQGAKPSGPLIKMVAGLFSEKIPD